jgi:hypothetical protein
MLVLAMLPPLWFRVMDPLAKAQGGEGLSVASARQGVD